MTDEALRALERDAKESGEPHSWERYARALARAGRPGDAEVAAVRALAADPESPARELVRGSPWSVGYTSSFLEPATPAVHPGARRTSASGFRRWLRVVERSPGAEGREALFLAPGGVLVRSLFNSMLQSIDPWRRALLWERHNPGTRLLGVVSGRLLQARIGATFELEAIDPLTGATERLDLGIPAGIVVSEVRVLDASWLVVGAGLEAWLFAPATGARVRLGTLAPGGWRFVATGAETIVGDSAGEIIAWDRSGSSLWRRPGAWLLTYDERRLVVQTPTTIEALDPRTGAALAAIPTMVKKSRGLPAYRLAAQLAQDHLVVQEKFGALHGFSLASGQRVWGARAHNQQGFLLASADAVIEVLYGKGVVARRIASRDPASGKELSVIEIPESLGADTSVFFLGPWLVFASRSGDFVVAESE